MKKILFTTLILLFSLSSSAQNLYWHNISIEAPLSERDQVASLIDGYYSSIEIPSDVNASLRVITFKGSNEKASHELSFSSLSAKSLADFRNSLKGPAWDLYISKITKYIKTNANAGKTLIRAGVSDKEHEVAQNWQFKVKNPEAFVGAFSNLLKSFKPDGYVSIGQIIHGTQHGENMYVYSSYQDFETAYSFGAKNESEAEAWSEWLKAISKEEYTRSTTSVLVKSW